MRDDERQRIFLFRTNVNEMNIQPVNLGHEHRQGVEARLRFPPVVFGSPIAGERMHRGRLHALRSVRDCFPFRPPCRVDASAEVGKVLVKDVDAERPDALGSSRGTACRSRAGLRFGQARCAQLGSTNSQRRILQKASAIINRFFCYPGLLGGSRCIHNFSFSGCLWSLSSQRTVRRCG